jgi:hypothetical protein
MKRAVIFFAILLLMLTSVQAVFAGDAADAIHDHKTRFAVIGDMPYSDSQHALLEAPDGAIAAAINAMNPPVLIHLGDFKKGRATCTDALFKARYEQISNLNPFKIAYTPGDNDWTDCDRFGMFTRYDELERLDFLRQLFFHQDDRQLTRDIPNLIRQQGFIENAMWKINGLMFATLHIPGTNNGREEIQRSDVNKALDKADYRDQSNEKWLYELFKAAQSSQAVVIAFHADIYYISFTKPACSIANRTDCDGYKKTRDLIAKKAKEFAKPVLVIHGDTQAYCLQQPYINIPNLWRLNAAGDHRLVDANQITFDPEIMEAPFEVVGLLDQKKPPKICDYSLFGL